MASCPAGHESATTDYCDVCGAPMTAAPARPAAVAEPAPSQRCASCGGARSGRFCEECGHDSMLPARERAPDTDRPPTGTPRPDVPQASPTPVAWSATVRADRTWFEEMRARSGPGTTAVPFPPYCPERRFDLTGAQLLIGRRNRARGVDPEIDLSGSPLDPGVSTLHAMLLPRPDGGWEVVDLGSTNGTVVSDGVDPIPANTPVTLADGDQIKIGAWTTITVATG